MVLTGEGREGAWEDWENAGQGRLQYGPHSCDLLMAEAGQGWAQVGLGYPGGHGSGVSS